MDIRTQAALLAAIVALALTGAALLRSGRPRGFTLFAFLSLDLFFYSAAEFLRRWPRTAFAEATWERASVASAALLPLASLTFFLEFLGVARRPARRARNLMLAGALSSLGVAASPLVHSELAKIAVTVYVLGGLAAVVSVLWRKLISAPTRVERARLLYLVVGAAVAVLLSALDLLPRFGVPYPLDGVGFISLTLFLYFLSQTLQRHRLLDLHEFLGKVVVVATLGLVLMAIYGGLVSWVGNRPELFYFNTLVASFVILSLFEPLRAKVEEWVVATLFRERFELVRHLETLQARSANVIDPARLAAVVLDGLMETRRVTHASLWLVADDRPGYWLLDSRGPPPVPYLEAGTARALLAVAGGGRKAILLENLDRRVAELRAQLAPTPPDRGPATRGGSAGAAEELARLDGARAAMAVMRSGLCMPLAAGDRVVGFLACWDERVTEAFASDEIAALIELAERCALVIENSKLYQQMKERDRLAALGEMAAGLAHEIRNPLAAIKGATEYLDPGKLPADDREFLEIIVEEVNRLNGVVTQFLDYSRPLKAATAPGDVNEILQRTFKLLQGQVPPSVEIALDLGEGLPRVVCDPEQLKQVFLNLALNAVQAMPQGGKLTVTTRHARDELALWRDAPFRSDTLEIRFRDTGPGIPEGARENVFVPFFTTKEKGTGLGLAICQRIVKAHQGVIAASSPPGGGAEFVISLPGLREERPGEPEGEPTRPQLPAAVGEPPRRRKRRRRG